MESKIKLMGHPLHPIMITVPLGLLSMSVLFDLLYFVFDEYELARTAFYIMGLGVLFGLGAGVVGFLDWNAIPGGTRAKQIGVWHALLMLVTLILFAGSWFLRLENKDSVETMPFVLSAIGAGLAGVGGWFGGEMVYRLSVGVDPGAHLNAPSSLSDEPIVKVK